MTDVLNEVLLGTVSGIVGMVVLNAVANATVMVARARLPSSAFAEPADTLARSARS